LEFLASKLHVQSAEDWYRVGKTQVIELGGTTVSYHFLILGGGMLATFGKLLRALKFAYPDRHWDEKKLSWKGKKSVQRYVARNE
jgi:hypothetical protein